MIAGVEIADPSFKHPTNFAYCVGCCLEYRYHIDMSTIEEILAAALALPSEDRAKLIPLLWDQTSPEDWSLPSAAWIAESNRRSDLIDNGEMSADDWENVRARARRRAGLPE